MNYEIGDLVVCHKGRYLGEIGLVTGKARWYEGGPEVLVVLTNSKKNMWYTEHVRLANEKDRLGESKGRSQE